MCNAADLGLVKLRWLNGQLLLLLLLQITVFTFFLFFFPSRSIKSKLWPEKFFVLMPCFSPLSHPSHLISFFLSFCLSLCLSLSIFAFLSLSFSTLDLFQTSSSLSFFSLGWFFLTFFLAFFVFHDLFYLSS